MTIHADPPQRALEQLSSLALQAQSTLSRDYVSNFVRETVNVFVPLDRLASKRRLAV